MKRFLINICFIFGFLGFIILILFFFKPKINSSKGIQDFGGNIIANDYNNHLAKGGLGMLVQIDDHLYFNYARDYYNYGTIDISKNGTKRIDWSGWHFLEDQIEIKSIRNYQNRLLLFDRHQNNVKSYFPDVETFEYSDIPYEAFCFQEIDDMIYYVDLKKDLIEYKEGNKKVLANNVTSFYCVEKNVYYFITKSSEIRCLNLETGLDELVVSTKNPIISFIVENECIFANKFGNGIFYLDLRADVLEEQIIFEDKAISRINAWNGLLYLTSENGLFQYDLESKTIKTLSEKSCSSCFLVDDYWVYFVGEKSVLWRVSQDGSKLEKVFG